MRYIKLLLFFTLVVVSKNAVQEMNSISLDTHMKMQQDFSIILKDAILLAVPTATEISNENIRSKVLSKDEIQIAFNSQFLNSENSNVKIILEGLADLNRIYENDTPTNKWSIDSFTLGDEEVEFQDEILIEVDRSRIQ
tara:strand:+ start:9511 stop:9927 length:417 start_codon:yes stop_codon:yes gene_type:complete